MGPKWHKLKIQSSLTSCLTTKYVGDQFNIPQVGTLSHLHSVPIPQIFIVVEYWQNSAKIYSRYSFPPEYSGSDHSGAEYPVIRRLWTPGDSQSPTTSQLHTKWLGIIFFNKNWNLYIPFTPPFFGFFFKLLWKILNLWGENGGEDEVEGVS